MGLPAVREGWVRREAQPNPGVVMSFIGLKVQHYRVFKVLGHGGMGVVYAAYDERLDRKVALKAIRREHRLKPEVKARLLREAQVLSGLEHPHICRIYDILDYQDSDILVLELIEGESLRTVFGPEATASTDRSDVDLLKVAEQVASALAAAHEQGVVHRDLKPDNVMLTPRGDVKVLDFGLARRMENVVGETSLQGDIPSASLREDVSSASLNPDHETPLMTQAGRFAGTPAYMSPEQVLGEPVNPASDMYALGILLQEMFTGKPAYEARGMPATLIKVARAQTASLAGLDPDLAALIERLESRAAARRPSAVDVCERLRWIHARPQRRRRQMLNAAAMAFLFLSSVALALQTHRIGLAAERANHEAQRANREAAISHQVSDFMVDLFELSDPDSVRPEAPPAEAGSITAREILAGGARKISVELAAQPLIRARLMGTIGEIQRKLGLFYEALPLALEALETRERILGPDHPDVAESQAHLANVYLQLGRFDDAAPLYKSSIRIRREAGGQELELAKCLNGLGIVRWNRGDYEAAEATYLETLALREQALGPRHPDVATSLDNLAIVYKDQLRFDEAEPLYRRSLEIREAVLGPGHNRVAVSLNNLGVLYFDQHRFDEAEPLYERAIAIWEKTLGTEHHAVGVALVNLANIRHQLGQPGRSRALYDRALEIFETTLGPDHPYVGYALAGRGSNLLEAGRHAEAEAPLARALAILEKSLGPEHVDVGRRLKDLARALAQNGETSRANALLERSRRILAKSLGADHPEVAPRATQA